MQAWGHLHIFGLVKIMKVALWRAVMVGSSNWWTKYATYKLRILHLLRGLNLDDIIEYLYNSVAFIIIICCWWCPKSLMDTVAAIFLSELNPLWILLCILLNRSYSICVIIVACDNISIWIPLIRLHLCLKKFCFNLLGFTCCVSTTWTVLCLLFCRGTINQTWGLGAPKNTTIQVNISTKYVPWRSLSKPSQC